MNFSDFIDQNSSALLNPLLFFDLLKTTSGSKFSMDSWQREVLAHLNHTLTTDFQPQNILIALAGARGCGKSQIAAFIALWLLSITPHKNTIVTVSANTEAQISTSIWLAFTRIFRELRFDIFLSPTGKRSFVNKRRSENFIAWQIFGAGDDTKVRGLHADVTVRIIDEALGVQDNIFHTILSGLTGGVNIVILLSNPISTIGFFADIFLGANEYGFYKRNISLFECEHIDSKSTFIQNHIDAVQRSDPTGERYNVEILGQFPTQSQGFFFSAFDIIEADINSFPPINYNTCIGIDVAAGVGADRTVISYRIHSTIYIPFIGQIKTPELTQKIMTYLTQTRFIAVDSAGLGIGIVQGVQYYGGYVHPVNGGSSSQNPAALNKRAELYLQLKAFLDAGGRILCPYGQKGILSDELRSIRVEFPDGKNGKLKIGDKKQLSHSPDIVDSLTYTFALNQPSTNPVVYY